MATLIDDRYRVKSKVNGGNMSSILVCYDMDKDDDEADGIVAIKMFDKCNNMQDDDIQEKLFQREVEALEKVQHPNVVRILDKGLDADMGKFYIVLEFIEGKNFEQAFDDICRYDYYQKLELMEQILTAIEYLHKKCIVHRDLKPSNLMFDKDNNVKVIDFGISRIKDTFYNEYTLAAYNTPKYSSPEQMARKNVTYQSDIYSLGLILYEIFTCEKISEFNIDILNSKLIPSGMQRILEKMLQNETSLRYSCISDIKRDLTHEKSLTKMDKFISLGLATAASKALYSNGYIEKQENLLAAISVEKDLSGKVYIRTYVNKENNDISYWVLGKQYVSVCKIDNRDEKRLTIIAIRFINNADLMHRKENAYEIPYKIKVSSSSARIRTGSEIDANILIDELNRYENEQFLVKEEKINRKDISSKWSDIMKLQKNRLERMKRALQYKNFKINENDGSVELQLKTNDPMEINFTSDDMLQMTSKQSIYRSIDIGYMRDYKEGKIIIDLAANANVENYAESGEVSISMRMADIALQRQSKALKNVKFKEIANPVISDIIFDPMRASAHANLLLSKEDCKSELIDESKLRSLEKALTVDDVFLLQGPPGTGKTTFISELVYQILYGNKKYKGNSNSKILIASQSHVAVDHSLKKIKELLPDIKMIRVGISDRIAESSLNYTLDKFCKEWTESVITNCKIAIETYKKKSGIDESLNEKNGFIEEIENLMRAIDSLQSELKDVESELEKIGLLKDKWNFANDSIDNLKKKVAVKTITVSEKEMNIILDEFIENLTQLNQKLENIIDESIHLSEQKEELDYRRDAISNELIDKKNKLSEWKEIIGVKTENDFFIYKSSIEEAVKENKKKYMEVSKIEALCKEWMKRVKLGEGLLQESLADATVVGATCLGIARLSDNVSLQFDWVIIDEAGKATPPEILVPIVLGKKIVLVGDHKQLPPVVDETLLNEQLPENMTLTKKDLETSLFEYLESHINENCKSILDEQYRMNPVIGDLISDLFYENKLVSQTSKEEKSIPLEMYEGKPLVWLTTSEKSDNKEEFLNETYRNRCEAKVIFENLIEIDNELGNKKLKKEVAIIAGYRAQRDLLISMWESQYSARIRNVTVEINTVDAFQGRETDIVFYSVVRSNKEGKLGFLQDVRRLNVAFSRARELLIVVGNHASVTKKMVINGQANPFVDIVRYIYDHTEDCILKEAK